MRKGRALLVMTTVQSWLQLALNPVREPTSRLTMQLQLVQTGTAKSQRPRSVLALRLVVKAMLVQVVEMPRVPSTTLGNLNGMPVVRMLMLVGWKLWARARPVWLTVVVTFQGLAVPVSIASANAGTSTSVVRITPLVRPQR